MKISFYWWVSALSVMLAVSGIGWFQYRQIDQVTLASERGRDNLIWDFYKLELQLANLQLALREVQAQPGKPAPLAEAFNQYNILVSQVQLLQTLNSGQVMHEHESFATAMAAARLFIDATDVHLAALPNALTGLVVQRLLQSSQQLRPPVHRLVLDAYLVENQRANAQFKEIRRFTVYYGLTASFLIVLMLCVGWLVLRNLSLTERRHLEQRDQLREKKEQAEAVALAKSRFLSAASHDLRQPAHALGLFVSQLTPWAQEPQARHLVACANAAVLDMQNMLDGLFDLSRLEAATTQVRIKTVALEPLFEQLRSAYGEVAAAKGLRLRIRPSPIWVSSDPVLLLRILLNLVSNALRYTDQGCVLVACRPSRTPGFVRLEVRDSGIGIAPENHEKIFQEFHQVDNPQRDRSKGLGMGLNIVQRCSRLLDQPVRVQSALGCGARFTFLVPSASLQTMQAPAEAQTEPVADELAGQCVLVIDDDPLGREALAGLLLSWGCKVSAASDAQAALAHCQRGVWPDLIISDFRIAQAQNGVEVIGALRALAGRSIAACVISGDNDALVTQQVQSAGLVLLAKPVRPAKLRGLLRNLVRQQSH